MRGYFHSRAIVAAFVVASLPVGAHAQDAGTEGVILAPSSDWYVDYADEKCRLARSFGEGENRHVLFLDQASPSQGFDLIAAGPAFKNFAERSVVELKFGETVSLQDHRPMNGNNAPFGPALIYTAIAPFAGAGANAKAIDYIAFGQNERKVSLLTGPLSRAFDAMDACTLDLIRSWGVDPDKHRTMTRPPIWKNPKLIADRIQDAYPSSALRKGRRGIFKLRAIIDEAGDVVECKLINATKDNGLDSPACAIFRRAEFEPARDAYEQPMKSYFITNIVYDIP